MGKIEMLPSLKRPDPFDEARFLKFLQSRSEDERWELIDGEPVWINPASKPHNRIAANLERLLNAALASARPDLDALREVPLTVRGYGSFLPVADVAVVPLETDDGIYYDRFFLAGEVLSDSNTREHISLKRHRYADCPECLHVLIVSQSDFCVEIWSRADDWRGRVLRSPADVISLPEFGFSCVLRDLYRRTNIR